MQVIEFLLVVAFIALFLGLSYGIKRLCRKYTKIQNCREANKENDK